MTWGQWGVFFSAWLRWGFDVFDGLLFNFVARLCVRLLGISPVAGGWWVALVPLAGLLLVPGIVETKGRPRS